MATHESHVLTHGSNGLPDGVIDGKAAVASLLIDAGADKEAQTKAGRTPLHQA